MKQPLMIVIQRVKCTECHRIFRNPERFHHAYCPYCNALIEVDKTTIQQYKWERNPNYNNKI